MKAMKSLALSMALLFATAGVAAAQDPYSSGDPNQRWSIRERQRREQARIREGVRSGQLTRREAARLEREEAQIRRETLRARADGRITPRERARIVHRENVVSRQIYRQKHDRQHRHFRRD